MYKNERKSGGHGYLCLLDRALYGLWLLAAVPLLKHCLSTANQVQPCARLTSILRVLQAIPSPLPVAYRYSIKIVQAEQNKILIFNYLRLQSQ
jgi:hypothetical protein